MEGLYVASAAPDAAPPAADDPIRVRDAREDPDDDAAVFPEARPDRWDEMGRLADLRVELIDGTGLSFDLPPCPAAGYEARMPPMRDIRGQGRVL